MALRPLNAPFDAPSGRTLSIEDLKLVLAMERNGTVSWSDTEVRFNSGFMSHVYFRARNDLSHNLPLLNQVAERIRHFVLRLERTHGPQWCLIGIPTAGTQLAQAAALQTVDHTRECGSLICFSTMRSKLKDHGKDNMWVGPPRLEEHSPMTIENIVSTAKAYLEHLEHLETDGYPTRHMHHLAFADWELGGTEAMIEAGYINFHVLYLMRDFIAALVYLGLWPQERYDEMNRRINAWRAEKIKKAA